MDTYYTEKSRGFTLIELIIVVGIIGILATIVLGSLGGSRDAARIVAVKSQLASMQAQAVLAYSRIDASYGNFCEDGVGAGSELFQAAVESSPFVDYANAVHKTSTLVNQANAFRCRTGEGRWAAAVRINDMGESPAEYFCVDSRGVAEEVSALPYNNPANDAIFARCE